MNNNEISSLYIHFPFCRHLCNYCDFYKNIPNDKELEYTAFETSLVVGFENFLKEFKDSNYRIDTLNTLYLGGGTPSLWDERGAKFLQNFLVERNIKLSSDCEFTLEVNPGGWTHKGLSKFRDIGANRFSLGIQSINPNFIKVLDRIHNVEDVFETLSYFKEQRLSFSVDFMLGLPFSDRYSRDIISELKEILSFEPEHISLYILTTKAGYIHKDHLPDDEYIEKEYLEVAQYLKSRGFDHYEVSNFSLPNKESRHNLKYWESQSVMALGASATGFLKKDSVRYKWKISSSDFIKENLTNEELKLEEIYMALRINRPVNLKKYIDNEDELKKLLDSWNEKKYLDFYNGFEISLNSKAFLILDSLINDLFSRKLI